MGCNCFESVKGEDERLKKLLHTCLSYLQKEVGGGVGVGVASDGLISQGGSDNIPSHFILQRVRWALTG